VTDLAFLEAYIAISAVKAQYCRTLDAKDWQGFGDCFTEDAEFDLQLPSGEIIRGRNAVVAMVSKSVAGAVTAHQVHNPEIMLHAGAADVIWPMQDRVLWSAERAQVLGYAGLTGYGHYHEHYVRQGGRWRIAREILTRLHVDRHPL
jgi:hypothetical protein